MQIPLFQWPPTEISEKIEKIQDRYPGLKFQARLKFSRKPPTKALFVGNSEGRETRFKFASENEHSSEIDFFKISGP